MGPHNHLTGGIDLAAGTRTYLAAFDLVPDMACLCRGGRIAFINEAGARCLGAERPADLMERRFLSFAHEDYGGIDDGDLIELARAGEILPLKLRRLDGSLVDLEIRLKETDDGAETVFIYGREITERIRAAESLLRSELRHRQLVESAISFVCTCEDERISYINPAGVALLGYDHPDDLVGRRFSEIVHPDYREVFDMGLDTFLGERMPFPAKLARRDRVDVDMEIAVIRVGYSAEKTFMVEAHDITEHNQMVAVLQRVNEVLEEKVRERTTELREEIAQRQRVQEELEVAATVFETATDGILITDPDFRITDINPAFTQITGFPREVVVGRKPFMLTTSREEVEFEVAIEDPLRDDGTWEGELWSRRSDGDEYALRVSFHAVSATSGEPSHYAGLISDITQRKRDEERIRYQANYDTLTGLANRSMFTEHLAATVATARAAGRAFALFFIDLDGFKAVNDTLGHDIGDRLLQEAAARLTTCIRGADLAARLGGDEFTVILDPADTEATIADVARRILEALSRPFLLGGSEARVSASIGIARFPVHGTTADTLLSAADEAMYASKNAGKATFSFAAFPDSVDGMAEAAAAPRLRKA